MKQRKQIIFYQGVPIWLSTEKKLNKLANQTGAPMHDLIGQILDMAVDLVEPVKAADQRLKKSNLK